MTGRNFVVHALGDASVLATTVVLWEGAGAIGPLTYFAVRSVLGAAFALKEARS